MKKLFFLILLVGILLPAQAQVVFNPNIAIRPMVSLSIFKIELTDSSTVVTVRIRNQSQLTPFSIKSKKLIARKSGEPDAVRLVKSENVPFYPEKHTFSFKDDILEFKLYFPPLEKPVKYLDIQEEGSDKKFYMQGIIIDPELNGAITNGIKAFQMGDPNQALTHFINACEMDLYFEFGIAYFNVIYILAQQKRWAEAKVWYDKFQERFFYDKQVLMNSLAEMGLIQRLEQGR
ncbi:MAG: hypothetical protein HN352_06660 [Bacteroidetes bacterium]|jgi:hypothetical protein|nr:hypothetical protein [Bacteroidota bacterium]MBT3751575.1 hypothetical protein [Bacteroidota bacterium]MBT4400248.1 hypothetical protein [Bacteroidota bacterium]MBT4409778.1 hypothetical protein [Bacteroidota bacterium]MBT5424768.1 hypothetical protein [Bacteroidota bacterium]